MQDAEVFKEFQQALIKCGLAEQVGKTRKVVVLDGRTLTPHHLRHGFVTKALAEGWSPARVAVLAGHSAAVSINRYLGAVSAAEVEGITEVTGRLLKG